MFHRICLSNQKKKKNVHYILLLVGRTCGVLNALAPCFIRQTLKYLEFLTLSDTINRRSDSKFDNDTITGGDIVYKILGIDAHEDARSPSIIINRKSRKENAGEEANIEEQRADIDTLKYLLEQEDFRGEETHMSNNRLRYKMQKIKNSSKNILNKKIISFKSMRSSSQEGGDELSLTESQSYSDFTLYSPAASMRGSAGDIGSGLIKRVKRTKPKIGGAALTNDGVGMTTLLVRSLMAAPSLDSIAENHDLPMASTSRATSIVSNRHTDSLSSLPSTKRVHTQNKLKLTLGDSIIDLKACDSNLSSANASVSSCTVSSSSENEEDDECSDINENDVVLIDADTISMVMKSVLAKDEEQLGEGHWIQPSDVGNTDDSEEEIADTVAKKRMHRIGSADMSSIKTGATRIIRPNSKKKSMETRLVESEPQPEMLESMLETPRDVDEESWIQPGSTADDADDNNEAEKSSLLQDFRESISERLHNLHLPHHHHGPRSDIKDHHGLLGTAMETMLMEQAGLMGAHGKAQPHLDIVEQTKLADKRNSSVESFKKFFANSFRRESNASVESVAKKPPQAQPAKQKFGLLDTAIKTMAIEATNIIENVGGHSKEEPIDRSATIEASNLAKHRERTPSPFQEPVTGTDERRGESKSSSPSPPRSFNTFCDSGICASHVLLTDSDALNAPSHTSTTKSRVPTFLLTSDPMPGSPYYKKPNQSGDTRNSLSPNREMHSAKPPTQRCINCCGSSKLNPLIPSSSCDMSINKTNKTKMLAPTTNSIHRSGDAIVSSLSRMGLATNGEAAASNTATSVGHIRADSIDAKLPATSPAKVPTSTSYGNTAAASIPANATTSGGPAMNNHGKDGTKENNICRRSSDSDLSVTPKGMCQSSCIAFYNEIDCKKKKKSKPKSKFSETFFFFFRQEDEITNSKCIFDFKFI